jgi:biotin carboxyl carrier protein
MYKINVNSKFNFNVDKIENGLSINGDKVKADIKTLNLSNWHIINDFKSYNAELVNFNSADKTAEIKINNNTYKVTARDQFDELLEKLGLSNLNSAKISELKAPMPGMVLKVFVTPGSEVKKGDNLFILEAMKMENIIKSPDDVTIKAVKITAGDKVEKGQVLLQFN